MTQVDLAEPPTTEPPSAEPARLGRKRDHTRDPEILDAALDVLAETADASDHPLLVADRQHVYLSWLTKIEGYRLIPLEDQP